MRRRFRAPLAVAAIAAVAAAGAYVQPRWFDHLEGRGIGARLDDLVSQAEDGATVDLGAAYQADWDRAIVIGRYWVGSVANSELGFEYFHRDETLWYTEAPGRIVFVRGSEVLADLAVETFTFDDGVVVITPQASRFVVTRTDGWTSVGRAP